MMEDGFTRATSIIALAAALGLTTVGSAARAEPDGPLPLPSLKELARLPAVGKPALSPSGDWFAAFGVGWGKRVLVVDDLRTDEDKPYVVRGFDWHLLWFEWLIDDRLLLGAAIPEKSPRGTPITVTRLILVDPGKREARAMFKMDVNRDNFQFHDRIVSLTPHDPEHVLVQLGSSRPNVYMANLDSGRIKRRVHQRGMYGVRYFFADRNGSVRVAMGYTRDQERPLLKIKNPDGQWKEFPDFAEQPGFAVEAIPAHDEDLVYVTSDHEYPLGALYEFHVTSGEVGKLVAHHPDSSIGGVILNDKGGEIERVQFASELVEDLVFDDWLQRFERKIDALLNGTTNNVVSVSQSRSRALILSYASNVPPHYYHYHAESRELTYIASQYPELAQRRLAKTELLSYSARDGLTIPAYVTLPAGRQLDSAKQLPFVVLPHGGPHARDFLRFDWLVQLLASEGYGVLQMNFRGSTGYGAQFRDAGKRQWGQAMQDDITDGTHWLIENGWADTERICIAGASYGGYAALMGSVKEPSLYRCTISLNGVSDLVDLLKLQSRYIGGRYYSRYIGNLYEDKSMLKHNSPARRAAEIRIPVLLVHGEDDRTVTVRQSRKMRRALEKAGAEHTYLELPGGDHHLSRGKNRLAFAEAAQAFLAQALGRPDPLAELQTHPSGE